jgi:hypothetical protein
MVLVACFKPLSPQNSTHSYKFDTLRAPASRTPVGRHTHTEKGDEMGVVSHAVATSSAFRAQLCKCEAVLCALL